MESVSRPSFPADSFNFIRIIVSNDVKSARIVSLHSFLLHNSCSLIHFHPNFAYKNLSSTWLGFPNSFVKLNKKQKIPEKFTERHEVKLPETVTLMVPNGDNWQVELIDLKGAIWFNNGWMEFAENYKLRFGHLLMFKYEGLLNFRVHIYDPSGCEMVYPKNRNHQSAHNSTEIKATSSLDSRVKDDLDDSEAIESDPEACSSWAQDEEAEVNIKGEGEGECSRKRVDRKGRKRAVEEIKASFTSDKPFFLSYMTDFHIVGRANVRIPLTFVKENWSGLKKGGRCVLRLGMDKRYKKWEIGLCGFSMRIGGWKIFMKDNDIAEDDICVFELIDPHKNILKVSIIRS
ncbi:hypothetical protein OSB04_007357 [Centaurea solstitialis]|uniref:TF-B3 domain-containing protein n=1 Tax=Centaurea solstitialis TaxID=347529 RepID=A0AA38U2Z0_9ASTR|nr:hypothetical protein OSB04_007357 [Centaurea solstitialis]